MMRVSDVFAEIAATLERRWPGAFRCAPMMNGRAPGLGIRRDGHPGHAFVFEPDGRGKLLLSLYDDDRFDAAEVWDTDGVDEIADKIEPWGFPKPWTAPAALDPAKEKARLADLWRTMNDRSLALERGVLPGTLLDLLLPEERARLLTDLGEIDARLCARSFPSDDDGRVSLGETAILGVYASTAAPARDRFVCLALSGPERRRDPQVLRLEVIALIPINHAHRWDRAPWLWRDVSMPSRELLGLPDVDDPDAARAARCVGLLDEGRIEEALALYAISLDWNVRTLLGGARIPPPACCAHPDPGWTALLTDTLRSSAPWRLAAAVPAELPPPGKKAKKPKAQHKLVVFPGQKHSRKASLMIVHDKSGLRIAIDATASNARLAETWWRRPLVVDLARHAVGRLVGGRLT